MAIKKAYYGSRISPNITKTPEGFMICHNVPIARTGEQIYLAEELKLDGQYGNKVTVYRTEEEVFHPATIASFEGKPITDEHPSDWVNTSNISIYERGHAQNIRRGSGDEVDLLLADLFIKNPNLISQIESSVKREVSCGYECLYVESDGGFTQQQIRGNHIAIVTDGRAGERVAIKDNKPKEMGGKPKMAKVTKNFLAAMGFKQFVQDADPEEIAQAAKAMNDSDEELEKKVPAAQAEDEGGDALGMILEKLTGIEERLSALEESDQAVHAEMDGLEGLEAELEDDAMGEEAVTIPAEEMDADVLEPGFQLEASEEPKNPITAADKKKALDTLRTLKPVIAAISDPQERRRASDALASSLKGSLGIPAKGRQTNGYGTMMNGIAKNVSKQVTDAQIKAEQDERQAGKDIAKRFNPHYKEK